MTVLVALLIAACSGDDGGHPPFQGDDSASRSEQAAESAAADANAPNPSCVDFQTRECVIDLGVTNGTHNCTKGVQICENGQWSTCAVPNP
jgi:hypothetical protein